MTQNRAVAYLDDPSVTPVTGNSIECEDAISRQHICEGAALRAVADYSGLDFATPPSPAVLSLIDAAYEHLVSIRPWATPQDFTVYIFSLLRECCVDMQEEDELKIAAAHYIVDNVDYLSADFAELEPGARNLLAQASASHLQKPQQPEPLLLMAPVALSEASGLGGELDVEAIRDRTRELKKALRRSATQGAVIGLQRIFWSGALACSGYLIYALTMP